MKKLTNLLIALCICSLFFSCDAKKDLEDIEPRPSTEITRITDMKAITYYNKTSLEDFEIYNYDSVGNILSLHLHFDKKLRFEYLFIKDEQGRISEIQEYDEGKLVETTCLKNYVNDRPELVTRTRPGSDGFYKLELKWDGERPVYSEEHYCEKGKQPKFYVSYKFEYNAAGNIIKAEVKRNEAYNDPSSYTLTAEYDNTLNPLNMVPWEASFIDGWIDYDRYYSVNNVIPTQKEYVLDDKNRPVIERYRDNDGTVSVEIYITYKTFTVN